MKTLFIYATLLIQMSVFAQIFELEKGEYPYYQVVEWKGVGSILLNRDPSGLKRKVNITCVAEKNEAIWQESFNPQGSDFYYISNDNVRYVYFLDQLQAVQGKISFSQINIAGNVKNSSVDILDPIKDLGKYDYTAFKVVDIITTDKALVFQLRYHDEKAKKVIDFLVSMTHNNFLTYAAIIGEIPDASLKTEDYSNYSFAGFTNEKVAFSARTLQDKKAAFTMTIFDHQAKAYGSQVVPSCNSVFESANFGAYGMTGQYHLKNTNASKGRLYIMNNKIYIVGSSLEGSKRTIELHQLQDDGWKKLNSISTTIENTKKKAELYPMLVNEGMLCTYGNHNYFLPIDVQKTPVTKVNNAFSTNNPSFTICDDKNDRFSVSLPTVSLFFDTKQLGNIGNVKFEIIKK